MNSSHLLFLNKKGTTWFNPSWGITGFWDEYRKVKARFPGKDHQYVWSHRDLKRAREIYVVSTLAKALEKQERVGRWWMLKPEIDPPDGIVGVILNRDGYQRMYMREVEVVENFKGSIIETIKNKLSKNNCGPETILVCDLTQSGVYDLEKLSKEIVSEVTGVNNIFLVFPGIAVKDLPKSATNEEFFRSMFRLNAVQVKPKFNKVSIDIIEDCKKFVQKEEGAVFINDGLGSGEIKSIILESPPKLF